MYSSRVASAQSWTSMPRWWLVPWTIQRRWYCPCSLSRVVLDVDALGQQAPLVQVLGDDPDRGVVDVAELVAGPDRGEAGLLGGVDRVVDLALGVGERRR